MQASCPRIAAMWAGVQALDVVTDASAPCHSSQCKHCVQQTSTLSRTCDKRLLPVHVPIHVPVHGAF